MQDRRSVQVEIVETRHEVLTGSGGADGSRDVTDRCADRGERLVEGRAVLRTQYSDCSERR
jgi:hypothetical protein